MLVRMFIRFLVIFMGFVGVCWGDESGLLAEDRGFVIYRDNCMDCHLTTGMGIREMNAPSIAGLPRWYVTDQLRKFRREERGSHDEDPSGVLMQMKAMTLGERDLVFVGKYIESLVPNTKRNTLSLESSSVGERLYGANCIACHGEQGEGVRSERAPPLSRQPDWYLLKQMENFRSGKRDHADDASIEEVDEDSAREIVAWIVARGARE
jgi:cytochrome c oxidase subunit 2